jgi:hypothetical protein
MSAHSGDERLGPYRLREQLGAGGMGVVYLAADPSDQQVAVKVLREGMPAEATARRRLAREVDTMRRVQSPHVAEVVDADIEGSPPYIVTRYVAGRTLEDVVDADGPLTGSALATVARGLAAALEAIHAAGVVHRDLKPGNVRLVDGEPVVIDFGIAQSPESTRLTMTGMFMGTPGYLAPEVIEGNSSGPAADVHSWAATMAYAATGRPPFGTGQFEAIFYRVVHGQPDLDTMPAPLLPIVLAGLAKDPCKRPSATDLAGVVAALNPASLVPAPSQATRTDLARPPVARLEAPSAAPAVALGGVAGQPWPGTRPMAVQPVENFSDLLPPVRYDRPALAASAVALPGASGRVAPPEVASAAPAAAATGRLPLVLATAAALVALSVLLPIAGAAAALAVLILLRAGDITTRWLGRRRGRQGRRPSDSLTATLFFPWAVCRSVLTSVLLAPLALLCAIAAAVLAVLAFGPGQLPRAGAYAAGALVACYCLGPGSSPCRRPLNSFYSRLTRTVPAALLGSIGAAAIAIAVIAAAATLTPGFWPADHLGNQLQAARFTHPVVGQLSGNVADVGRRLLHWLGL